GGVLGGALPRSEVLVRADRPRHGARVARRSRVGRGGLSGSNPHGAAQRGGPLAARAGARHLEEDRAGSPLPRANDRARSHRRTGREGATAAGGEFQLGNAPVLTRAARLPERRTSTVAARRGRELVSYLG